MVGHDQDICTQFRGDSGHQVSLGPLFDVTREKHAGVFPLYPKDTAGVVTFSNPSQFRFEKGKFDIIPAPIFTFFARLCPPPRSAGVGY